MVRGGPSSREVEEFPRRIKIFLIVIAVLLLIGTLGFKFLNSSTFGEGFIRTLETLAFMFDEESILVVRLLEIFLSIVGVFLIWWVLWSVADMILDGNLKKYLKKQFYIWKMKSMGDHIIIVGGGRFGEEIAKVISLKKKSKLVIIENDEATVKSLRKKKYNTIEGDASDEKVLKEANIATATKIILTLPQTEKNIMITLSVKEMNPQTEIYARADDPALISKLKRAGAKLVVVPEVVAGDKIAEDLKL